MEIGRGFRGGRARWALAVCLLAVAADLGVVWRNRWPESVDGRRAVALTALAALQWLAGGDLSTVGLNAPAGGWRRWVRLAAGLGVVAAFCTGAAAGLWLAAGWRLPVQSVAPGEVVPAFLRMCVFAPQLEETIRPSSR